MDCKAVKKNLNDYIEGEVQDERLVQTIKQHLDRCTECREIYERKLEIKDTLLLQYKCEGILLDSRKGEVIKALDSNYYGIKFSDRVKLNLRRYKFKYLNTAMALAMCIFILALLPKVANEYNMVSVVDKYKKIIATSERKKEAFAIYLVKGVNKEANEEWLSSLILEEDPILTESDIASYDWDTHKIKLKSEVAEGKLNLKNIPLSGRSFVLVSKGKRIYEGTLWNMLSSANMPSGVLINLPPSKENELTIQFKGTQDPRDNREVKEALNETNKISKN
jgi:hypothetical protein